MDYHVQQGVRMVLYGHLQMVMRLGTLRKMAYL